MNISEQFLKEYFSDKSNLFLLWNENDQLSVEDDYFPNEHLSLFIPLSGHILFRTNFQTLVADSNHIQFFIDADVVRITEMSKDYKSVGIIFSSQFWNNSLIHTHPYLSLAVFKPCLEVTSGQRKLMLDFYNYLQELKGKGKPDSDAIVVNLILGLFFHIGRFYEKWSKSFPKQSDHKVLATFLSLLFQNYREHRDVGFYADKIHMSKKHFSEIIKASTGLTAYQCIERYCILKIYLQLRNTQKSIKEIAYDLNFSDDSYFCKFFKKHTGQSPQEFRNGRMLKVLDAIDEHYPD